MSLLFTGVFDKVIEFRCRNCSFVQSYCDESVPQSCPKCQSKSYRLTYLDKEMQPKTEFVGVCFPNKERWSWSMGCHVNQIPEMMTKYPGRTYNPKTGQLLIQNRTEKKRLMREHGMEET